MLINHYYSIIYLLPSIICLQSSNPCLSYLLHYTKILYRVKEKVREIGGSWLLDEEVSREVGSKKSENRGKKAKIRSEK